MTTGQIMAKARESGTVAHAKNKMVTSNVVPGRTAHFVTKKEVLRLQDSGQNIPQKSQ